MAENQATRGLNFKNVSKSNSEMRSRRHETTIELRKNKKEDQMFKRRNIDVNATSPLKENNALLSPGPTMSLDEIITGMRSNNPNLVFQATQSARKMLSQERNPPINTLINNGIVPLCVQFLDDENQQLQFEASWALTNIASGTSDQTMTVVNEGAVPKFIALLNSPNSTVAEQSVWALGNIAGDGPNTRDIVLKHNAVEGILALIEQEQPVSFVRNVVWLMSNLCRNKNPAPPFEKVKMMLPVLSRLLQHTDTQILTDAAWAISYVTDDVNEKIQSVINAGCVPHLVKLLGSKENVVIVPALRSVGNIVTGDDSQTDAVLQAGALRYMPGLLNNSRQGVVKEAAWTISNITAGNPAQIQAVLEAGIFEEIRNVLINGDYRSQKEAAWVITNSTSSGNPQQVGYLMEKVQILQPFCNLLDSKDARTVIVVLSGLANLFQLAEKLGGIESLTLAIEENGALDKLEILQSHGNEEVYQAAYKIIEAYFTDENGVQDEIGPSATNEQFEFAAQHPNGGFNF